MVSSWPSTSRWQTCWPDTRWVVYLPGPALLGCLVLGLLGGLGVGRARRSGLRSICLLLTVTGAGLLAIPDLTTEFFWRYQVPALALLPAGAALGLGHCAEVMRTRRRWAQ